MNKFTLYDSSVKTNRTRKTKRWLSLLTFCMMIIAGQMSFAQCINGTSFGTATSNNSGDVQGITTCMYTSEYNNLSGFIIGEDYIFTATQSGVDVYITITDTSNTVIEHGPSPLTVNNITASSVRLHATNDAACGSSNTCTVTTMQYILSCPQPVSLTAFNMTESSADLEWTEEGSATTWDIEWGTMGFAPTGTPNITGVTSNPYTLTGLTSGTVYSFYVRSDCGVDDGTSIWSGPFSFQTTADCSSYAGGINSVTDGAVCGEGSTILQATASGTGSEIYWYDAEVGGNLVGEGTSFETPFLSENTSYWATEVLHDNNLLSGQAFANPTVFTNSTSNVGGLLFNVVLPIKIIDVEVFGTNATGGDVTIELRDIDNGNVTVAQTTATITGGGTAASPIPHTIPLNFYVPPGNYRLVRTAANPTGVGMGYVSAANSSFPYPLGSSGSVTGGATATATSTIQYFFFNWTIEEISLLCESDREEVTATVHEIIGIDVTATETIIDFGDSTTLTASSTNSDYTYEWTWDGGTPLTGASVTVSPTEHTTYTVTATDTVTGCQTSEEIEILVYNMALCDDIEILTTTDASVCGEGATTTLQATASGNGSEIYWYDAAVGGNLVGQGPSFETPELTETASYWATEVYLDGETITGVGIVTPSGTGTNSTVGYGIQFTVTEPTTLVSVDVLSTANGGDLTIGLYDVSTSTYIASHVEAITGGQYHTIPLNFDVPAAGTYRLVRQAQSVTIALRSQNTTGTEYPYPIGAIGQLDGGHVSLTGTVNAGQYMFYNWNFSTALVICESDREEVTATVYDVIDIDVTAAETTIDFGDNTTLSASSTNPNYTYEWTWDGGTDTGASITVSPTEHTIYTVIATDSISGCQTSKEIEILVYDLTLCDTMEILTTTDGSVCDEGTVTLSATASGDGDEIYWFDAEVGGNKVGQGTSFETPELTETTSYWAAEVYLDGGSVNMGPLDPSIGTANVSSLTNHGMNFTVLEPTTLVSVEIFPTAAIGTTGSIEIREGNAAQAGTIVETISYTTTVQGTLAEPVGETIMINVPLQPGSYTLTPGIGINLIRNTTGASYPYTSTVAEITGNTFNQVYWYWFYNWQFGSAIIICESDREEVIASVHETIGIEVTATDTELLPGQSATLSASSTNTNYTYEWTWDGGSETGASITVSPIAISTIYTVTATDPTTGCQTQESIEIFTFDSALCDDLEIATTIDGNVCDPGNTTTLQATGSSSMGDAQIFWYDSPTGGNKVGQGEDFTTPALTTTTSYWASEVLTDGQEDLPGQGWLTDYGTNGVGTNRQGMIFEIFEHTTLVDLEVWSTGAGGVVDIELYDMANVVVGNHLELVTTTLATGTAATPAVNTVTLNWELAPGVYKIVRAGSVPCRYISGVANFGGGYPIPFDNNIGQITAGSNTFASTGYATAYYYFFNWTLSTAEILCESEREEVTATVHEIIDIDVTATETIIDAGDSVELTATSTNTNYTYEWIWDDGTGTIVTGTGSPYTAYPTTHTTFTVIATDTVTGCQTSKEIEILVYDLTLCDTIEILTTTDGSVCDEGTVTLSTTASGNGDNIYWYDAPTGGNLVGQGTPFETPELTETTSFWASEVYLDGGILGGQAKELPNSTTGYTLGAGLAFTATESFTIVDVTLYSNSTAGGTIPSIQLQTITGTLIAEVNNIPVPAAPGTGANALPFQAPLNIDVPGPGDYRLLVVGSVPSLIRDSGAAQAGTFPYPLGTSGEITGSILGVAAPTVNTYYYFYNWTISTAVVICESDREEVIATVHEIDVTASETTIDFGDSTTLSVTGNNPDFTYEWTWDGGTPTTGDSLTVSPTEHTTYTVTATDSVTGCQIVREIEILVYDLTICDDIEILTTIDGDICSEGTVTLSATASDDGDEIYWYDAPTGGNLVGQGATFTTPELTETTSYWVSEVYLDAMALPGQAFANPTTFTNSTSNTGGVLFTVTNQIKIVDVQVFGTNATGGEITIELRDIDNGNATVATTTATITGGGTTAAPIPHTITLNFDVPPGNYRLVRTGATPTGVGMGYVTAANSDFPYPLGVSGQVTGGATATGTSTIQYYFFNWTIEEDYVICESEREEVTATVHNIDITATATTIDPGDSVTLTASSTNPNYVYEWTWDGGSETGATITVTPASHTTYTVTAIDPAAPGCENSAEIKIIVFNTAMCNELEVTSTTDGGICDSGTTVLQATAGSGIVDAQIYWYDAPTGGNVVGQGTEFTTPNLTTTTSFWAAEVLLEDGGSTLSGQAKLEPTSTTGYTLLAGLEFVATEAFTIINVEAYSNNATGTTIPSIELQDASGNVIQSITNVDIPNGGTGVNAVPFTIALNFNVPGPGTYRLMATGSFSSLLRDSGAVAADFPHNVGTVAVINQGILGANTSTSYYYFYNWTISSGLVLCESDREEAVALVVPASSTPVPTGSANQTVYGGTTLADLDVTGTDLIWYSDAALTNPIPDTTPAQEGTFYVTQTLGYCEGAALAVTVTLHCSTPTDPIAVNTSATSVSLSWTSSGDVFDIEYGPAGFTPGTGTVITEVGNPYTLGGLTGGVGYDFYVRQNCTLDEDGYSAWRGPESFTPGLFDGDIPTLLNANPQVEDIACANSFNIDVPEGYYLSSLNVEYVMMSWNGAFQSHQRSVLYSPTLNMGEAEVVAGTTDFPGLVPYSREVTFANGATGTIEFQLKAWRTANGSGCNEDYVYVMDGSWVLDAEFELIPTCPEPTDLAYTNPTADSVDLVWMAAVDADPDSTFDIQWGLPGFDPEDNEGTTISELTTTSHTLSGLDSSIVYEFYVRSNCSTDDEDDFSAWVGPVKFNAGYCIPSSQYNHYITTFLTTEAEDNIAYYSTAINGSGYGDKTDMVVSQLPGESFNFSLNYVGGQSGLRIWVDWNNDFVFGDDEEMYYFGSASGAKTGNISIPSDAAPGNYVMRVRTEFGATAIPSACGHIEYGEALDFTLNVATDCSGIASPTGDAAQTLDLGDTLADLVVAGADLTWYSDEDLTMEIADTTEVVDGTTYYVTQTVGDCTSDALAITVTVVDPCAGITAPTADSPQMLSEGQTVADIVVTDVTGTLNWYSDEDLTVVVEETDVLTEGVYTFWVTQTVGDCTSDAVEIMVEVSLSRNAFDEASFRAYPNPVTEFLNISYSKDITDVSVINMLGQIVISQTVSSTDTQVDMSALPTGSYLVKVTVDGAVKTIKVVKQ